MPGCRSSCSSPRRRRPRSPAFTDAFHQAWSDAVENDGFNRLVLLAGLTARQVVVLRAYCKIQRQAGSQFSQAYMEDHARRPPGHCPRARRPVRGPVRPGADARTRSRRSRTGAGGRAERRRGPYPARLSAADPPVAAHQLLPARGRWRAETAPLDQALQPRHRPVPAAAPAVRGVRLRRAHGGLPPARRPGRAGRHPLERPQGGFPHRGARLDEGADGEERRYRAGRQQGRFRAQAPARARHPRGAASRGHRLLPHADRRPARPHRHLPRHRNRASRGHGAPRPARPLPGRRRRQGHRDLLRHRQRRLRRVRLLARRRLRRPAARSATTTRPWASPPAAPGRRSSATSANSARTASPPRSPAWGSATCRATCSATACCCPRRPACSPPSTTCTSSSTPPPTRSPAYAERQRLFDTAPLYLGRLRQGGASPLAAAVFSNGRAKSITLSPEAAVSARPARRPR